MSGVSHPLFGRDHLVAMLAVGLWGSQLGNPALWVLPVTFPLIMAVGGFLGVVGIELLAGRDGDSTLSPSAGRDGGLCRRPPLWVAGMMVAGSRPSPRQRPRVSSCRRPPTPWPMRWASCWRPASSSDRHRGRWCWPAGAQAVRAAGALVAVVGAGAPLPGGADRAPPVAGRAAGICRPGPCPAPIAGAGEFYAGLPAHLATDPQAISSLLASVSARRPAGADGLADGAGGSATAFAAGLIAMLVGLGRRRALPLALATLVAALMLAADVRLPRPAVRFGDGARGGYCDAPVQHVRPDPGRAGRVAHVAYARHREHGIRPSGPAVTKPRSS